MGKVNDVLGGGIGGGLLNPQTIGQIVQMVGDWGQRADKYLEIFRSLAESQSFVASRVDDIALRLEAFEVALNKVSKKSGASLDMTAVASLYCANIEKATGEAIPDEMEQQEGDDEEEEDDDDGGDLDLEEEERPRRPH